MKLKSLADIADKLKGTIVDTTMNVIAIAARHEVREKDQNSNDDCRVYFPDRVFCASITH